MATAAGPVIKYKQELPPPGGYKEIKWTSGVPKRGYSGLAIFGIIGLVSIPTWWLFFKQLHIFRIRMKEQADVKYALMPFIMAERDRKILTNVRRNKEFETELMADIPGWKVGCWYDEPIFPTEDPDKWFDPTLLEMFQFRTTREAIDFNGDHHFY